MPARKGARPAARKAAKRGPGVPRKAAKAPARRGRPAGTASGARPSAGGQAAPAKPGGGPITGGGAAAVERWLAGVRPGHRALVRRVDALIREAMPDAVLDVKWRTPVYGLRGQGWIVSLASFKAYVAVVFFRGADLDPPPPSGEGELMRRVNIPDLGSLDEAQLRGWLRQAATLPGWAKL